MSSVHSYACFGCVDFANNSRTYAYYKWACANGLFIECTPPAHIMRMLTCSCSDDDCVPSQQGVISATWDENADQLDFSFSIPFDAAPSSIVLHGPNGLIPPSTPIIIEGDVILDSDPGVTSAVGSFTIQPFMLQYLGSFAAIQTITSVDFRDSMNNIIATWYGPITIDGSASDGPIPFQLPDDGCYDNPITDDACWYDPLIPESGDFLGIIIDSISGLRTSTFQREVTTGIAGGSILGQPYKLGKQLQFTVYILATSCAGMDYGIEWMRRQLEDSTTCPKAGSSCASCQGQVLMLRVHCTDEPTLDDGLHTFQSAGTIDGFSLVEGDYPLGQQCCCTMRRATFTIQTESADSYSAEPITTDTIKASDPEVFGALMACETSPKTQCCPVCAATCDPCTTDPGCDCVPPFILEPAKIGVDAPCFSCVPCRCIGALCINNVPSGYETALRLTLFSGIDPLNIPFSTFGQRNTIIRIFENPQGLPCPDDTASYEAVTDLYAPCAEIGISWIPPGAELVIDGTSGQSWLKCNGQCVDHSSRVSVISGSIQPLTTRCTDLIAVVEWDCLNTQENDVLPAWASSMTIDTFLGFRL